MDSVIFDKPFKEYHELIELMKSRNIIVNDEDLAKDYLSDISYYSLINGYKNLFPNNGEKYLIPIIFEELLILHQIDTQLNSILFRYIINIEKSLKSKMSYIISKNYGVYTDLFDMSNFNPTDYLCRNNYRNSKFRNNVLCDIKKEIQQRKKEADISHYLNAHNHLPCWILINNIPFGLAIKYYQIFMPLDKDYICSLLVNSNITNDEKKRFIIDGLIILKEYRNKLAHGKKVFVNSISKELEKSIVLKVSKGQITNEDYINGIGKNDLFATILILITLTRGITRRQLIYEITSFLESYEHIYFSGMTLYNMLKLPSDFITKMKNME